ncbi:NAD(P)/FAD-dependent oxidoreductase [uncultured Ruegeria sp.]|uniref:flavin monoamine oxidase family protein n=1 Tax=uncultured Ruegeria sp. TaxID=259304 RepID=UPI00260A84CC|nr:NAD(P)/FAD-dependent oxidoreductase [uncultured Ruegeria sp.]
MRTDTLIIGGGLSGLSLATQLVDQGQEVLVVEARNRLGGRILTEARGDGRFDMGPAWFWPGQPRIAALIERLGLHRFDQFSSGTLSFEDEQGRVKRGRGFSSMEGSYRLMGGLAALTDALSARLPDGVIQLSTQITALVQSEGEVRVTTQSGRHISARHVVLAIPPRIAAELIFEPALPDGTLSAMREIATWMAGQAKALAVYDTPFWRDDGLSGDAMSRSGPMVEIHDASPASGGPFALFGFIGIPPQSRRDEGVLRQQVLAQLGRLFGHKATRPSTLFLKDWAFDRFTATDLDLQPLYTHPQYGLSKAMTRIWEDRIIFSGTETAAQFGGYLEGALEAAETTAALLSAKRMNAAWK